VTTLPRSVLHTRLGGAGFAVVSAPAGFGKTWAVREAFDLGVGPGTGRGGGAPADGEGQTIAWAQLGTAFRTDAETVAQGLASAAVELGALADATVGVDDDRRLGTAAHAALATLLEAVPERCTLILDDLHRVPLPLQAELVAILHPWIGGGRRLIVATRHGLSTLSDRWPLHRAELIVQPADLFLDAERIGDVFGPDLAPFVDRVAVLTGGWANGVDVLHRHLLADPIGGFDRAESVLQALIVSEVLPLLRPDDVEMLMTLSLCDIVPMSVAERACSGGATVRLRALAVESGLLTADGDTVGLVPLFAQALERRMTTNEPASMAPTHGRIAQAWLDEPATAASTVRAVHHLLEAGAFEHAVEVLQHRWGVLYTASRVDALVELMERVPVRYWADDAGCALLVGWANLLIGRSTRALELIQSQPLRTPVGAAIKRLVWAQGVWWSTGPAEALQLIAEGRTQLDELPAGEQFPNMPGNDDAPAFRIVADGAEVRARFLLGDLSGSAARADALIAQPSQLEPISVAGLHALGALVRAFCGDRNEAITHLRAADSLLGQLDVADHYVMFPAHLARALLAVLAADPAAAQEPLDRAVRAGSDSGAANFQRLCELVADLGGLAFDPPNSELSQRAARLPFLESYLAVRAARRRADLGDAAGAASMLKGKTPSELTVSSWLHVLLQRHPLREVRGWLAERPAAVTAHGQVVRLLADATVADSASAATSSVRRAVAIASDQRLLGVICDAPAALWDRPEIARLDLPLLVDARRILDRTDDGDGLRFTTREIELLRLLARSATAGEIAGRLYVSVNTVKWHKANIYRKLGVSGSRLAVERAVDLGVLGADDLP
jgi:LuxR family maltose regulon positive regulatory protein